MGLPRTDALVDGGKLAHMKDFVAYKHVSALIRFRLGCWDVEANRPVRNGVRRLRAQRWCRVCRGECVEDEKHALLECEAYAELRVAYGISGNNMKSVMLSTEVRKLAAFLYSVQSLRASLLRGD